MSFVIVLIVLVLIKIVFVILILVLIILRVLILFFDWIGFLCLLIVPIFLLIPPLVF
jgi:hypothetical protein